ncbi:MAG: M56 family metallopeptidase [Gemmatimonadetes bacterium]|nr:M56 family metallopeptidase [Gemmatimonadota bacterium]
MDGSWALHAFALPVLALLGRGTTLVGAYLLTYAVHSTVLLLSAWWLVTRRRLAWAPAAQHAIWGVALVGGWVTSAVQLVSPWHPLGGALEIPHRMGGTVAAVRLVQDGPPHRARALDPALPHAVISQRALSLPPGSSLDAFRFDNMGDAGGTRLIVLAVSGITVAVGAWALVAMLLLGHLALSRRRLLASLETRRDASDSLAGGVLRHLVTLAGTTRAVSLSTCDALPSPAAISHSEIVVPSRALHELTLAEQEGVLAHELAHVLRGDPAWLRLATCIERAAWFQPLNRVARRQMQLSAEFAADAWAVRVTRQPLRLAQALARVAEWMSAGTHASASHAPGFDGSPLVERVRRLTAPSQQSPALGDRLAHSTIWLVAAGVLTLLPRLDTAPAGGGVRQRVERVVIEFAVDSGSAKQATTAASWRHLRP